MVHGRKSGSRRAGSSGAGSRKGQVQVQVEVEVHLHLADCLSTRYVDRGNLEHGIRVKRGKAWHFATEQLTGIELELMAGCHSEAKKANGSLCPLFPPLQRPDRRLLGQLKIETRHPDFIRNPTTKDRR